MDFLLTFKIEVSFYGSINAYEKSKRWHKERWGISLHKRGVVRGP
jgi:hypothetical protein